MSFVWLDYLVLAQFAVRRARQVVAQLQALAPTPPAPDDAGGPAGTTAAPGGTETM